MSVVEGGLFGLPSGDITREADLIGQRERVPIARHVDVQHVELVFGAEIVGHAHEGSGSGFRDAVVDDDEVVVRRGVGAWGVGEGV